MDPIRVSVMRAQQELSLLMVRERRDDQAGATDLRGDAPPAALDRLLEIDERARPIDRELDRADSEFGRRCQRALERQVIEHLAADPELHRDSALAPTASL